MPGFDRTGPAGRGPVTGGRRGRCVLPRTETPEGESATPVPRGGVPRGCGRGFCGGRARGQ